MNAKRNSLRIIHIVHGKANPSGHNGISRVVYYLNKQEKALGVKSEIWALVDGVKKHYSHKRDEFVSVECFPRIRVPFGSHQMIDQLVNEKDKISLVHFHLIWFYDKNIIARALKKLSIPFIITSHGTYSTPHAYTGKRLFARWLYETEYLNGASEIHILSREEGTGLRKFGFSGKTFVVGNGIDPAEIPKVRSSKYFDGKPYRNKIKFIWIGVLREDKNLRALIEAVSLLPPEIREQFVCIFVGPDYKNNDAKFRYFEKQLGVEKNFDHVGPLYGQQKYDAIESSNVFVLPSFSEGVSLAMLDAMVCAKPCLITPGCGFNYYESENCFVRCEPYAQDIAAGILQLFELHDKWCVMGENGQRLIQRTFNWEVAASSMVTNYKRITGGDL